MKFIKELGKKVLFIILICIIVLIILLLQCFVFNKEKYDPKSDTTTNYLKSGKGISTNESSNSNSSFLSDAYDAYQNTDVSGKDYNTYNFDDSILMYEGDQDIIYTTALLEKLIKNADDSFYSKPTVTLENFGNTSNITYTGSDDYKLELTKVKEGLIDGATYNISFGYTALHAVVNEIIITKK